MLSIKLKCLLSEIAELLTVSRALNFRPPLMATEEPLNEPSVDSVAADSVEAESSEVKSPVEHAPGTNGTTTTNEEESVDVSDVIDTSPKAVKPKAPVTPDAKKAGKSTAPLKTSAAPLKKVRLSFELLANFYYFGKLRRITCL